MIKPTPWPDARRQKFRQAGFVYLHVAVLYLATTYVTGKAEGFPLTFVLFMFLGVGAATIGFLGVYYWQNAWFTRFLWLINCFRLPALIESAFVVEGRLSPAFYIAAGLVVLTNLGMLARAGWDL